MPTQSDIITVASGAVPVTGGRAAVLKGIGVQFGDSLTAPSYGSQPARWSDPLTRCPPLMGYNAGVPNHTLLDLINRVSADVLSRSPSFVDLRAGTNSLALDATTFRTQYRQLIDALLAGTPFVLIRAIPPNNGQPGANIVAHNTWLENQCKADPSRLAYIGDCDPLGDSSFAVKTGRFIDGIHMSGLGQYESGVAGAPLLTPYFTTDPRLLDATDKYSTNPASNQYVKNPHMSGTAGVKGQGITGTVATDWNVGTAGSGTTGGASIIFDAGDPIPWQRIQLISSGATGHYITASTRLAHPAIAANGAIKRFDSVVEARLVGVNSAHVVALELNVHAAGVNIGGFLQMKMGDAGVVSHHLVMRHAYERTQGANGTASGNVALAAYTADTLDLNIGMGFSAAFTGGTGFIDIRCASVRGLTT